MATWNNYDGFIMRNPGTTSTKQDQIIAFDLDHTLIQPKNNHTFPDHMDPSDWEYRPNVLKKLKSLSDDDIIVIFTNQSTAVKNEYVDIFKQKIEDFLFASGINNKTWVFIAVGSSKYRKPSPLLWWEFQKYVNVTSKNIIYVGDAAGRLLRTPKRGKKLKPDFSDTDRKFALNLHIIFETPEQYFDNNQEDQPFELQGRDASDSLSGNLASGLSKKEVPLDTTQQEIIVMVGYPGSGKSSFVKDYLLPLNY